MLLLDPWLGELRGDKAPVVESAGVVAPVSTADSVDVQSRNTLRELIRLLLRNGALGETVASALMKRLRK
jgi:hypothetical protein